MNRYPGPINRCNDTSVPPKSDKTRLLPLVAGICLLAVGGTAWGVQLKTGSDWVVRWDTTAKYNLMVRAADQDKDIYANSKPTNLARTLVADDSDLNFDQGSIVSNRLDLLTEFDVVWRDKLGVRISAAGWYDHAYSDKSDHPGLNEDLGEVLGVPGGVDTWGALSVKPGEYTDETEKFHYFGGEFLDAFVFASFDSEAISGNVRLGRHTVFWGNSLAINGAIHGIAGSMVAIDFNKALSVPGSDAQELFLPTSKLSTVLQLTSDLTFNAYWSLEYMEYRQAQLGAYFSAVEIGTEDSEFLVVSPGVPGSAPKAGLVKADDETPDGKDEWGANLQYYLASANLDIGFVYLNYNDKHNASSIVSLGTPTPVSPDAIGVGEFKGVYKDDVDLFGLTFNKQIAGISMGLEFVRRENAPLPSESIQQSAAVFAAADSSNYPGAVGDTWHAVLNGVVLLGPAALWDGGTLLFEVTASWLDKVTENEALLSTMLAEDRVATSAFVQLKPQWFQVFNGTDLTMPMSVSYTIDGDAPIALGGNKSLGNASIGLEFLVKQTLTISAAYNAFFGPVNAGGLGLLKDRDNVVFTVKRTF